MKAAEVDPPGTMTETGTVKFVLFEESPMTAPPAGAALLSFTMQKRLVQEMLRDGGVAVVVVLEATEITPPAPLMLIPVAPGDAPAVLTTDTGMDRLADERNVNVTPAIKPAGMVVLFMPAARQVVEPLASLQKRDLPAVLKDEPATTLTDATSAEEYDRAHCMAAGWLAPGGTDRVRPRDTEPPCVAAPDERVRVGTCPSREA